MKSSKKLERIHKKSTHKHKSESQNQNYYESNEAVSDARLKKILDDRVMKNVPYPATNKLTITDVFDKYDKPRVDLIKNHFFNEGRLTEEAALKIINKAETILKSEKNVIYINPPVTIVGDIHGQFYDLLSALSLGGSPDEEKYLFLGDYVDRGHFSIEVLLYLYSFKILYPGTFYLLRGNHECRHLTEYFTFKKECLIKYSINVYLASTHSFNMLPLAAVINDHFLCVHGGITHHISTLQELDTINRFQEIPQDGKMCDILWSDPHPQFYDYRKHDDRKHDDRKNDDRKNDDLKNTTRGCSYYYTHNIVSNFLAKNKLLSLIRAHEAQDEGFRLYKEAENSFPSVITIFSAPNYLDVYNNKGAIMTYRGNILNAKQFSFKHHPYWLPNFMDVFTWSLPFIVEKVTEMFIAICNIAIDPSDADNQEDEETLKKLQQLELQQNERKHKHECIRTKLRTICKVASMYSQVRRESELYVKMNGITPVTASPLSSLINPTLERKSSLPEGATRILGSELERKLSFDEAKELDKENESFPKEKMSKSSVSKDDSLIESFRKNIENFNYDESSKKLSLAKTFTKKGL